MRLEKFNQRRLVDSPTEPCGSLQRPHVVTELARRGISANVKKEGTKNGQDSPPDLSLHDNSPAVRLKGTSVCHYGSTGSRLLRVACAGSLTLETPLSLRTSDASRTTLGRRRRRKTARRMEEEKHFRCKGRAATQTPEVVHACVYINRPGMRILVCACTCSSVCSCSSGSEKDSHLLENCRVYGLGPGEGGKPVDEETHYVYSRCTYTRMCG